MLLVSAEKRKAILDSFVNHIIYYLGQMHPIEREIKDTTEKNKSAFYLGMPLSRKER